MSTKHTPTIGLAAAQTALNRARESCPHWDYENDGGGHECCCHVDKAKRELARAAVEAGKVPT